MQKLKPTPFIDFGNEFPGIIAVINYDKEFGEAINTLAETLLRRKSTLTVAEREYLAAETSAANNTEFCEKSHRAFSKESGGVQMTDKLNALKEIAVYVATGTMGSSMSSHLVDVAKELGATEMEIHETIAIASAFCFFNRIVMYENTPVPIDEFYPSCAERICAEGYMQTSSI